MNHQVKQQEKHEGQREQQVRRQFRHGDLLVEEVDRVPADARKLATDVLAEGEATGHAHKLVGDAEVLESPDSGMYLRVVGEEARLTHEEHKAIVIPLGEYRVIRQREFNPWPSKPRETRTDDGFRLITERFGTPRDYTIVAD